MSYSNNWSIASVSNLTSLKDAYQWNNDKRVNSFGMGRLVSLSEQELSAEKDLHQVKIDSTVGANIPTEITEGTIKTIEKKGGSLKYYGIPGYLFNGQRLYALGNKDTYYATKESAYNHSRMKYDTSVLNNSQIKNWNYNGYPNIIPFLEGFTQYNIPVVDLTKLRCFDKTYYEQGNKTWCVQSVEDAQINNFLIAKYDTDMSDSSVQYHSTVTDKDALGGDSVRIIEDWSWFFVFEPSSLCFIGKNIPSFKDNWLWNMLFYINRKETNAERQYTLQQDLQVNYRHKLEVSEHVKVNTGYYIPYYKGENWPNIRIQHAGDVSVENTKDIYFKRFLDVHIDTPAKISESSLGSFVDSFLNAINKSTTTTSGYHDLLDYENWSIESAFQQFPVVAKGQQNSFGFDIQNNGDESPYKSYIHLRYTNALGTTTTKPSLKMNKISLECPIVFSSEPAVSFYLTTKNNYDYYQVYYGTQLVSRDVATTVKIELYNSNGHVSTEYFRVPTNEGMTEVEVNEMYTLRLYGQSTNKPGYLELWQKISGLDPIQVAFSLSTLTVTPAL